MNDDTPVFDQEGNLTGWWVETEPSYISVVMMNGSVQSPNPVKKPP